MVAKSFARIFFRNAINTGLALIQSPEAAGAVENGEVMQIDFEKGELVCRAGGFRFPPLPDFVLQIIQDGGLIPHTKRSWQGLNGKKELERWRKNSELLCCLVTVSGKK